MKRVFILAALAGGLMFSCTTEEKTDEKEVTVAAAAEEKKAEEATTTAIHDLHENVVSVKAEIKDVEAGLDNMASELNELSK